MIQINRIRNLESKVNEYERIIKLKLKYHLHILDQLAKLDALMSLDEDDTDNESEIDTGYGLPMICEEDEERIEPCLPITVINRKRGRPNKKH